MAFVAFEECRSICRRIPPHLTFSQNSSWIRGPMPQQDMKFSLKSSREPYPLRVPMFWMLSGSFPVWQTVGWGGWGKWPWGDYGGTGCDDVVTVQ